MFTLGVVSNCWGHQLPETGLAAQCRRAVEVGYGYVELRQRALAECEERVAGDERPWPLPERLRALAGEFPGLGFNLALELPFMTEPVDAGTPYLQRLTEAALALAGAGTPVLRFVDISPAPTLLGPGQVAVLGQAVGVMTRTLWQSGVRVALENSKQPVGTLRELVAAAAPHLDGAPAPQLCWDAGNQVSQSFTPEDPVETARTLPLAELFEFHFKQLRGGAVIPEMGEGDLDWPALVAAMRDRGYRGPALFEIPPGADIWHRLEEGTSYVRALGA